MDQQGRRGAEDGHGTVVIIEDDRNISDLVDLYLRNAGFRVLQAPDATRGLEIIANEKPSLVLLDIGLPGPVDGIEACREIRKTSDLPVVFLTARDDEVDRVLGLELGADDYIVKPFSPRELVARVRAILRRAEGSSRPSETPITVGGVTVDSVRREATVNEEPVQLTAREFDLLAHFVENPRIVFNRRQLLDAVWGVGWIGDERTVDVHVRQLRRKLGEALPLTTIWGVGYRCD
ncbi:MAG TPA: response regulator transcription factor [Acidimicrobiales bacterium]|nr:response regulator transcription factor [Acidimicrobiales bacterium]